MRRHSLDRLNDKNCCIEQFILLIDRTIHIYRLPCRYSVFPPRSLGTTMLNASSFHFRFDPRPGNQGFDGRKGIGSHPVVDLYQFSRHIGQSSCSRPTAMPPTTINAFLHCSITNTVMMLLFVCVKITKSMGAHTGLVECLKSHSLPSIVASSPNYTSSTQDFNVRVSWKPLALVTPSTADEIALAINCANDYDVKVAARGGGHSYAGNGLGGADGSLVIDMKRFKTFQVVPDSNIAIIGAGNRLGDVATGLYEQGKRGLPHGICPG